MAKEEFTQITLTERIIQAAAEIVAMHTRLPIDESRFLCEKVGRLSLREFGLATYPAEGSIPLAARYAFTLRAIEMLRDELTQRGFDAETVGILADDLDTFYRGVRRIPTDP